MDCDSPGVWVVIGWLVLTALGRLAKLGKKVQEQQQAEQQAREQQQQPPPPPEVHEDAVREEMRRYLSDLGMQVPEEAREAPTAESYEDYDDEMAEEERSYESAPREVEAETVASEEDESAPQDERDFEHARRWEPKKATGAFDWNAAQAKPITHDWNAAQSKPAAHDWNAPQARSAQASGDPRAAVRDALVLTTLFEPSRLHKRRPLV
jgi:hypothetical protein